MEVSGKRRSVRRKEVDCLELLYRFRFITASLLVEYGFTTDSSNARRQLQRLVKLGLLGQRYDKSFKIERKPAYYYLTPAGVKVLRYAKREISNEATRLIHRDPTASEKFIQRCLNVLRVAILVKKLYGEEASYISRAELYAYDNVLVPLPDAFVRLPVTSQHYYLELVDESTPPFAVAKRIRQYIEDAELDEWRDMGSYYPPLLLVTVSQARLHRIQKVVYSAIESADSDLPVYGTSLDYATELGGKQLYYRCLTQFDAPALPLIDIK